MKLYLIGGKAGSGKNLSAEYIKDYYEKQGKKVLITELSKYLKNYVKELTDWDGSNDTKPRSLLQEMGSLIRHDLFNEMFFINRLKEDIKLYEKYIDICIVADLRLPIELENLRNIDNAVSFKIINGFSDNNLSEKEKNHETELGFDNCDDFDYIILNETKEKLKNDIENILKKEDENE